MTILLYKDGKLIVDTEQPLEGVSLDNLAAILSGASDGDVIQYDATNGMWVNKSAPSSLPEVTASDKGKYLKANESTGDPEWASGGSSGSGVLVVHETVSGTTHTLDKTWQEIHDADFVVLKIDGRIYYANEIGEIDDVFFVGFLMSHPAEDGYSCLSASEYPAYDDTEAS